VSAPQNPLSESPVVPDTPVQLSSPSALAPPRENPPWDLWDVIGLAVLTFVLVLAIPFGTALLVRRFWPGTPSFELLNRPDVAVAAQLITYLLVSVLAYHMVDMQTGGKVLAALRWNWPQRWEGYLLAGFALEICLLPFDYLLPMPKSAPIDQFFRTARDAYILSSFGIFFAPLFEELFFRGFLYPALARRFGTIWSILLTALAFAGLHILQLRAWGPVLVIFLVGLALTIVRALRKSVAATVLMHMAYNTTLFVGAFVATDGFRHMEKINH
jgi:membrane protease YdiL (CAAX protease family)